MRTAIEVAAQELGLSGKVLLSDSDMLIYGTTRATNAVVTKSTAKTAFLTTRGFRDILSRARGQTTSKRRRSTIAKAVGLMIPVADLDRAPQMAMRATERSRVLREQRARGKFAPFGIEE
jgi:N-methylhydantoinase A/oxoprolinase/acetone carboxylase beta subunit